MAGLRKVADLSEPGKPGAAPYEGKGSAVPHSWSKRTVPGRLILPRGLQLLLARGIPGRGLLGEFGYPRQDVPTQLTLDYSPGMRTPRLYNE